MGELIKNGISYTTTTNDALSIDYDNKDSGLEANNVQDAIDEVNDSLSSIFDTQILNNNTTIPVTSANQNIELYKHTATKDEVINISAFYNSYGYINRVAWIYITLNDVQVDFSKTVCTAVDETTVQVRLLKQLHSGDVVKVIRGSNQASGTHNYTLLSNLPRD